jgi:hypothetical protein
MRARITGGLTAAAGITALVAVGVAAVGDTAQASYGGSGTSSSKGLRAVGLTGDGTKLVAFDTDEPKQVRRIGTVKGLTGDMSLIGIDYRVQDGKLYGVGDQGGVYTVSSKSAKATKVSQLTVALQGMSFGVDFNPAANRLRVVSDTGQNLRHNIDDGATAGTTATDGPLTIPPGTTPVTGVTGAAYTNNDLDPATATTLYDLDTTLDQIAVQAPANAGPLSPTGLLGVDAGTDAGFDVYSDLKNGRTSSVTGFATLQANGRSSLYRINLVTGEASLRGSFPIPVTDLAIALDD